MVCPHCKKAPYPLKDDNGKIIIKNLFKMDWLVLVLIAMLLFSVYCYKHDTKVCKEVLNNPCDYIDAKQCITFNQKEGDVNEGQLNPYMLNEKIN